MQLRERRDGNERRRLSASSGEIKAVRAVGAMNSTAVRRVACLDYASFVRLTASSVAAYWRRYRRRFHADYSFPASFINDLTRTCSLDCTFVGLVLLFAVLWTLLRVSLTNRYFLPWCDSLKLTARCRSKAPESAWKLAFYSLSWSWSVYVMLLSQRYTAFWDPLSIWDTWHTLMAVPPDIFITYVMQCSFYVHSIYATLYMDVWRKDSLVMMAHHFLTITLLTFSYASRHHMEGALLLLLHDVTDIQLEFTKLNTYMKARGGRYHRLHDVVANMCFCGFAVTWFVFRLYWFPLKVIYAGVYGGVQVAPADIPFFPIFTALLFLLLAMNLYWFHFIVALFVRVATRQQIADNREYDYDAQVDDVRQLAAAATEGDADKKAS